MPSQELSGVLGGPAGIPVTLIPECPAPGSQAEMSKVHRGNTTPRRALDSHLCPLIWKGHRKCHSSPSRANNLVPGQGLTSPGLCLLQDPGPVILHYPVPFLVPSSICVLFLIELSINSYPQWERRSKLPSASSLAAEMINLFLYLLCFLYSRH